MCTPWRIARQMRWRVQDWASGVFARLLLDDQPDMFHSSVHQVSSDDTRSSETNRKLVAEDKRKRKTLVPSSTPMKDNGTVDNEIDSHWPPLADEDYIVFCFKEDGAFDVVKNEISEASGQEESKTKQLRSVNRKLNYGGDDPTSEESNISAEKGEDGESIYFDPESPPPWIGGQHQIEDDDDFGVISLESSISNQSDGSTSSFAFPVLRWEWRGSPVQMPNSEGLHLRKQKAWRVGLHCCRF
ncbi:hypothetical protein HHK36_015535 [Tetracentron sinense]|uniref:Protein BREAKING OF ASYMMETRY IN THE STOMATAL LINEAGE n=1 Tax=Tetracentron sinense TaxID=13715 RepID=A0A835DGV7_TETSI|nr:hypothetical protein HHK36_015535 [Tetracentron sinense]